MPARNAVKIYTENGFYHIYNRGVEKRDIFLDNQDYKVFLYFLKRYLTNPLAPSKLFKPNWKFNLFDKLNLVAYCLMPNHFHLLLKQFTKEAITEFMRALSNSYVRYFNQKYKRVGPLFQGKYKGVLVESEPQLLHLTRYIHLNPLELQPQTKLNLGKILKNYPYSSYKEYLGQRKTEWIHPEEILDFFKTAQKNEVYNLFSYRGFVENHNEDSKEILDTLSID